MSTQGSIGHAVDTYLNERRRLGFQLTGSELRRFARYADGINHKGPITEELQISWARLHVRKTTASTGNRRLRTLRPFVRHYCQYEPASVVLDPRMLGTHRERATPHIYTANELADLVDSANALEGSNGLRGPTYATLFGLIAATGLRLSEAIDLADNDVDLNRGQLTVRMTKFRKTRLLPLQDSTVQALIVWRKQRDHLWSQSLDGSFFIGRYGTVLKTRNVEWVFEGLRRKLDWKSRGTLAHPRIHDLRHTFAVRRVQLWHEQEASIDQAMFWLSTYLGHAKISDTYWYLTGVPELMAVAGRRFDYFAHDTDLGAGS
jgi:integrase/recombinase XerC